MKKIAIMAFAAILTFGASSCSKARTCSCDNGVDYPMTSAKKSDQKKACDVYAAAAGTSCSVK